MTREDHDYVHRNYENDPEMICDKCNSECPYKCDNWNIVNLKIHLKICNNRERNKGFYEGVHTGSVESSIV